jgi:hypothetical protein
LDIPGFFSYPKFQWEKLSITSVFDIISSSHYFNQLLNQIQFLKFHTMSNTFLHVLFFLALLVAAQSKLPPGLASFDNVVANNEVKLYASGEIMGNSGWKTTGRVHLASGGQIGMPDLNPYGLQQECMFQTYFGDKPYAAESSITRTFTGLNVGETYRLSFWQTSRSTSETSYSYSYSYYGGSNKHNYYDPPMIYGVYIDGTKVFSTVPVTNSWVQVQLAPFIATSNSVNIRFFISSTDQVDRDIGINAVILELIPGIYTIISFFKMLPFKRIYIEICVKMCMYIYIYIYKYIYI